MAKWTWEEAEAILYWTKNVSIKKKIPFSDEHCEDCLKCHEKVTSAGQSLCVGTILVLTVVNIPAWRSALNWKPERCAVDPESYSHTALF